MSEINTRGWFARHAESEARKDVMKLSERAGELVGVFCILVLLIFFGIHQTSSSGFFTSRFGSLEQFLFYGSPLFGIITGAGKIIVGRRNAVRPLEAFGAIFGFGALLWLLRVFPFDFSHLSDVLPGVLRWIAVWITNDIARVFMMLGIIGSLVTAVYITALYVSIRKLSSQT